MHADDVGNNKGFAGGGPACRRDWEAAPSRPREVPMGSGPQGPSPGAGFFTMSKSAAAGAGRTACDGRATNEW
jgi:hypothetical protein